MRSILRKKRKKGRKEKKKIRCAFIFNIGTKKKKRINNTDCVYFNIEY